MLVGDTAVLVADEDEVAALAAKAPARSTINTADAQTFSLVFIFFIFSNILFSTPYNL
jgi:hypothetical protein